MGTFNEYLLEGPRQQLHKSNDVNSNYLAGSQCGYKEEHNGSYENHNSSYDNHNDKYESLFSTHVYWLNHPKSFIYRSYQKGLNKFEITCTFPLSGHSNRLLSTEHTPNTKEH